MPPRSVCAEIGAWRGDFSSQILKVVRPTSLHLIDPWRFQPGPEYDRARYGGALELGQREMDRIYASVERRFRTRIREGTVHLHRRPSSEAAGEFPDRYFDWIYVDGNHLYEFVKDDLERFEPKVKRGGLIAGDDYGVVGWWEDGVTRAVDDFVASGRAALVTTRAHQFVLRTL